MDDGLRARLAAARAGRNPYTDFRFAAEYTDVPPTLGDAPAFEPSYPPYPYQRQAAHLIDNVYLREIPANVLVASPTGSGKSFAIQWAARRALEEGRRLIVGVPLVALAEQIYGQLRALVSDMEAISDDDDVPGYNDNFDDDDFDWTPPPSPVGAEDDDSPVGIRTGPSEKYPDAPVVVCTYEVVVLLLHHSLTLMDASPLIIIDEIHTIADPDRGHVVETLLTDLPAHVSVVGMSGTLPNALELAEYMGRCNQQPTHIIGAKSRPISLEFHLHVAGAPRKLHTIRKGQDWDDTTWKRVHDGLLLPDQVGARHRHGLITQLARHMEAERLLPAMCVAFSCRGLDAIARDALGTLDFLPDKRAKAHVHFAFAKVRRALRQPCGNQSDEEWTLFASLLELAKRGIGIHHAQNPKLYLELLPGLVRKGRVRLILATSTLSAGIDLPVRTVAFVGGLRMPHKHGFRCIEPNLFHQICGRAGRPGQETEGHVIIGHWAHETDLKELIMSDPKPVRSQYQLTASLVLRVLARPQQTVEAVLRSTFASDDVSYVPPLLGEVEREAAAIQHRVGDDALVAAARHLAARARRRAARRRTRRAAGRGAPRSGWIRRRVRLSPRAPPWCTRAGGRLAAPCKRESMAILLWRGCSARRNLLHIDARSPRGAPWSNRSLWSSCTATWTRWWRWRTKMTRQRRARPACHRRCARSSGRWWSWIKPTRICATP